MKIKRFVLEDDLNDLHKIIQKSFRTVADEFGYTEENAPSNPAFISIARLKESFDKGIEFYICIEDDRKVGCIALEKDPDNDSNYFVERLAVLPEFRHRRIGKYLLDFIIKKIDEKSGRTAGIAIVNENLQLKNWYLKYGFTEDRLKKFEQLPFTVCFMSLNLT